MCLNSQETPGLVTFTEETLNGKLHSLCSQRENERLFFSFKACSNPPPKGTES